MEIWISFGDVTQARDAEEEFVFGFFGYVGTAFVVFRIFDEFPVRAFNQTEFLEGCAAKVDAAVAGDTAVVHKGAHAFALLFVQGVDVAFEVVIPFGRRQQGAFECAQCSGDVFEGNCAVFREGGFKQFLIFGDFGNFGSGCFLRVVCHFHRVHQWSAGLFFNVGRTAVPELHAEQGGV